MAAFFYAFCFVLNERLEHRFEQYFTSAQFFAHFLRQVNDR
jgi:hypothetical protein